MQCEDELFSFSLTPPRLDAMNQSNTGLWDLTVQEIDDEQSESSENIQMKNICGPSIRNYLASKSVEKYIDRRPTLESICYQTAALSIWTLFKYQDATVLGKIAKVVSEKKITNMLVNFCVNTKTDVQAMSDNTEQLSHRMVAIRKLIQRCSELPTEWTVLQLCRQHNPMKAFMLSHEILKSHDPLCLTLFSYPRSELLMHEPISVIYHHDVNVYAVLHQLRQQINVTCKNSEPVGFTDDIREKMELLRKFVGPWLVLFSGKAKHGKGAQQERKVFSMVDEFCDSSTLKFSKMQKVLISLIARRLDLLTTEDIRSEAALQISKSTAQNKALKDFFEDMHMESIAMAGIIEFHPLIMIVEETLDFINWEMCIPTQESTRVSSLNMLFQLFDKYRKQIRNGFVMMKTEKGFALLNPDKTLQKMQERMHSFFTGWTPRFSVLAGQIPTANEMQEHLSSSDVYIYSGHGNGLQYINGSKLQDCSVRSVSFLFGCESATLTSKGLQSEMFGANLYLHYAQSPAVLGFNTLVTDLWTDIISVSILTSWIPSRNGAKWYDPENPTNWLNSKLVNRLVPFSKKIKTDPNLLSILCRLRCDNDVPARMRIVLVCRGLPMYNSLAASSGIF